MIQEAKIIIVLLMIIITLLFVGLAKTQQELNQVSKELADTQENLRYICSGDESLMDYEECN